jgi:protochlorophyllide reductase
MFRLYAPCVAALTILAILHVGSASPASSLSGMVALVTGSSTGIGKEVARRLHESGANVIVSGRDLGRCEHAIAEIRASSPGSGALSPLPLDLTDFASVQAAATALASGGRPLHLLFLNAGMVYAFPPQRHAGPWLTEGGYDHLFAANHLGHFLLCNLLLPLLKASSSTGPHLPKNAPVRRSRVIVTSSIIHWLGQPGDLFRENASLEAAGVFEKFRMYGTSKLANVLFAYELQRRLDAEGAPVDVAVVTPGLVATEIGNSQRGLTSRIDRLPLAVSPRRGADTSLFAATVPEAAAVRGAFIVPYFAPPLSCRWAFLSVLMPMWELVQKLSWRPRLSRSSPDTYDKDLAKRLWLFSCKAVGLAHA